MTEYTQLIPQNIDLEEDETIDTPITTTSGRTTLIPMEDPPHGRHLGLYSTIVLFVGRMIGSGIFATPGGIFKDINGDVSMFLIVWIIGASIAMSGLSVYLELGSLLPRSGATKVFLEYLFPWPKYYASFIFGIFNVLFNISSGNALIFGQYSRYALGLENDEIKARNLALGLLVFTLIAHGTSRRLGLWIQNFIGGLKLFLVGLMILITFYVIIIPTSITGIENNLRSDILFKAPQLGKHSLSIVSSVVLRTIYSFGGWTTPHMVQNEIKNPIQTLKIAAPLSMLIVVLTYVSLNLSYLIVIPSKEILKSGELIGAILFEKLFGPILGRKILSSIIAISAASNLLVVVYADSLLIQSIAREGFLPFSNIISSNYPNGTPILALFINVSISIGVLFLPQNGDIYNYIVSMQVYPNQLFHAVLCIGIYKARHRFPQIKAPIRSPHIAVLFCFVSSVVIFAAPFSSPSTLVQSYSFGGIILFGLATVYWFVRVKFLPWLGGYKIARQNVYLDHDGLRIKKWTKVYK
ncbi:Y+L amino acid transporter [Wickerhamomyces ciferrii]|uniref:Y+L amino acid transporter n=1 Tax=Wickerhamomyces ciferrii (strain ATCC 14091 / BCRC 22168 / CBS 111 / JCM 3599 / NBRC 0793 / NRRL Y-1031 F-60-10) TaxID=1206466 RepID=K0KZE4_WICCF|nr:Y+L amino acid transporter [Wickerhamomyces ciferrii]CCH46503.1 Y+L amino acid transporter [Wickerhamomyces ciferrii]